MKYDYLWYKSVDNKIIFFLNNSLWTTYHPYVVELISHIAIYFSTISIFLSLKVQVMPVHIYKRPRLEWQQVLCVCVCTSKNTLQMFFSQVKICTNIDLHKIKIANVNLQKVGDACNVFLSVWRILGESTLLHLCLQHSTSCDFSQNHFLQVSGQSEPFLP